MNGEDLLDFLHTRRSVRTFAERPIPRPLLERLVAAASTAPSSSNRQPWRYAIVTEPGLRARIVEAVRRRAEEQKAIIRRGHHGEDYGQYGDFFHEPLATAAAIVIPQHRSYPDLLAQLIASGGGNPTEHTTPAAMQAERCSTSAATMLLLLQAHAEGLGACWMAGPTVAQSDIAALLGIAPPWQMLGAIALGYPASPAPPSPGRKPLDKIVEWFEEKTE